MRVLVRSSGPSRPSQKNPRRVGQSHQVARVRSHLRRNVPDLDQKIARMFNAPEDLDPGKSGVTETSIAAGEERKIPSCLKFKLSLQVSIDAVYIHIAF